MHALLGVYLCNVLSLEVILTNSLAVLNYNWKISYENIHFFLQKERKDNHNHGSMLVIKLFCKF